MEFKDRPIMKCGCVAMVINHSDGDKPWCLTHDCGEIGEQPILEGRKARCFYYGEPVKNSIYNRNCCQKCKVGENCQCERPSSRNLWFFVYKPAEEFDEFYCACNGAD